MANPFTVQPLGGLQNIQMIGQGMQGIAQNVQADRAEEQRQALMQQAAEVFESGDPRAIAQFSIQNPEIGKAMMGGIKFQDEVTEQNLKTSMQGIIAGRDPEQILKNRIQTVESRNGDASDTRRELEVLREMGPEQYRSLVRNEYAMAFGDEGLPQQPETELKDTPEGYFEYTPGEGFKTLDGAPASPEQVKALQEQQAQELEQRIKQQEAGMEQEEAKVKRADDIRSEVTKKTKELGMDQVFAAMNRIEASNDGTPAGDLALIFNFMKMLDPGSVVREGEFATAQNATGIPGRIRNLYNNTLTGERLDPEQRENFTNQARKVYKQSKQSFEQAVQPYLDIGRQSGLTKDEILGEGYFDSFDIQSPGKAGPVKWDDL